MVILRNQTRKVVFNVLDNIVIVDALLVQLQLLQISFEFGFGYELGCNKFLKWWQVL